MVIMVRFFNYVAGHWVVDPRCMTQDEILFSIKKILNERSAITGQLNGVIRDVQKKVLKIFDDMPAYN